MRKKKDKVTNEKKYFVVVRRKVALYTPRYFGTVFFHVGNGS